MYMLVDYKKGEFGIKDTEDGKIEYFSPVYVRENFIKRGVSILGIKYTPDINPMYTVAGMTVNIVYRHVEYGKWTVAVLNTGEYIGSSLSTCVSKPTVIVYNNQYNFTPLGQQWGSYYLDTFMAHKGKLVLDYGSGMEIDELSIRRLQQKIREELSK